MAKITDPLPDDVQERHNNLITDLDAKVPAKELNRNLLIATWNIRAFGDLTRKWHSTKEDSPRRDLADVHYIAEIISRFDVIALQEVKANIRALRDTLKLLGSNWSMILTDVTKGSAGNGERMAYLFDNRRVKMSGLACELVVPKEWLNRVEDDALEEQFYRSPYAVSFRSENKTFILVTLHIKYGKSSKSRISELRAVARWMKEWATDINAYDQNLIALGDFNINRRGDLLNETFISEGLYIPPALQDEEVVRSIFDTGKFYDQIAWFQGENNAAALSLHFTRGGNYDFVTPLWDSGELTKQQFSWKLSDHYPLWAEFDVRV